MMLLLYILLSAGDIAAVSRKNRKGERICKPLLMPSLLLFYLFTAKDPSLFVILAIAGGFFGDTFLLGSGLFFVFGLLAFLAGHICYMAACLSASPGITAGPLYIAALVLYAGYVVLACRMVMPSIEKKLRAGAALYMAVLLAMSYCTLLRFQYASPARASVTFIGSLLFILSDSLLAYRIFIKKDSENTGVLVMITYTAAQFLIVAGLC